MTAKCGGKRKQGPPGATCERPAGAGTEHVGDGRCKLHGGCTPSHVQAAATAKADRDVRTYLGQHVVIKPIDNPLAAYREFAGKAAAWLEASEAVMAKLTAENMRYYGKTGEQLRAEVVVFERAMSSMNTVLATYARLNIDERLASVSVEVKKMILRAIEAALANAGVSGPKAIEAKQVAARHLRSVGPDDTVAT